MNMTTVPSNQLKAMQHENAALKALSVTNIMIDVTPGHDGMGQEIYAKSVDEVVAVLSDMGERLEALYGEAVILRATIKAQEHWQDQAAQQAAVIEQMREAFRVASMDTETINRKAPEIAKGCCSMPTPDPEGTYHLANEEVCNVVSSYLYWLHKNQPTALQPSPEILQARDKRVAEACAKVCIEQSEGIARSTPVSRDRLPTLAENTMFKGIARAAPVRDCSESSVRESAFRIRNGAWERHL